MPGLATGGLAAEKKEKGKRRAIQAKDEAAITAGSTVGPAPDLAVKLHVPETSYANHPLRGVRAVLRNGGKGASGGYRVVLEVEAQGSPGAAKVIGGQSGRALGPGAKRTHRFNVNGPGAGRYQLCARIESNGDVLPANDQSCTELQVQAPPTITPAEGPTGGGEGIPSGSYTQTCTDIEVSGKTLRARCRMRSKYRDATLASFNECVGDMGGASEPPPSRASPSVEATSATTTAT